MSPSHRSYIVACVSAVDTCILRHCHSSYSLGQSNAVQVEMIPIPCYADDPEQKKPLVLWVMIALEGWLWLSARRASMARSWWQRSWDRRCWWRLVLPCAFRGPVESVRRTLSVPPRSFSKAEDARIPVESVVSYCSFRGEVAVCGL